MNGEFRAKWSQRQRHDSGKVEVKLANTGIGAVGWVGARDIRHDASINDFSAIAISGTGRAADEMVALIRGEDEQRIALVDSSGLEVGKKFAKCGVVVTKLFHVRELRRDRKYLRY